MEAPTCIELINDLVVPEDRATTLVELLREADDLVDAGRAGRLRKIASWPFPGGPTGMLVGPDACFLHGAYVRTLPDGRDIELVVCNAGWLIERQRCPGPIPPPGTSFDPLNHWLAAQPFLAYVDGRTFDLDPDGVAALRVAEGRKPFALVEVEDETQARALQDRARNAGLAVAWRRSQCDCGSCDGLPVWFIEVARREPFEQLVDLDAVADWYATALPGAGAADHLDGFTRAVRGLHGLRPTDFLGRSDPLVLAPYNEEPEHHTAAVGLVLGYWPPASAALHLRCLGGPSFADRYGEVEVPHWGGLRRWTRENVLAMAGRLPAAG